MPDKPEGIIREEVRALVGYHVPDAKGMIKLDAMENPYGLPEDLRGQIAALVSDAEINRYPDAAATRLKSSLRSALNIPAHSALLLGNGSDELIQMLMLATARPDATVVGLEPSFVMFKLVATFCGMRYIGVALKADFSLDSDAVI